jgi:DNA-binding response OmpR family regulator/anti-sigma regulatory factor (Ser/Thr protein kinase)
MSEAILVVDDSLTVRMDLANGLAAAGLHSVPCRTLAEARMALARDTFALVILDVLLPDGEGLELLAEIRASPAGSTPVMLLSMESEVRDRLRGLATGANDYIGKPYDLGYVVARAYQLVGRVEEERSRASTILLVDDGVTFRQELRGALVDAGYQVVIAGSGEEGLRVAADLRPTAVVVDGVLPGIHGGTVVRRIRLDAALRRTPCLLLTGSDDDGTELRALDDGADAFVRKDEDIRVILARLAAMLRSAAASVSGPATVSLAGPKKILAVDDSRTYLHGLADALHNEGYDIILATSGEEALELLGAQPVECVLLDLIMPGLGGEETCRRIKSAPAIRDTPLVMLTSLEDHEAIVRGLAAGADDFISKSSDVEVLKARVRAQIRRKHLEDEGRHMREQLLRGEREAVEARASEELRSRNEELLAQQEELRAQSVQLAASQAELTRRNEEISRASRLKSDFLANMSHELRTPLNAVIGFSDLLLAEDYGPLDAKKVPVVKDILAAGKQLLRLINDVLDLSKIEAGRVDIRCIVVDVGEPVREACAMVGSVASTRSVEVVNRVAGGAFFATADPDRLRQVLLNLASNAVKFTPAGGRVTVDATQDEGQVRVTVVDTGIGIAASDAHRLFAPFSQLDSGYNRRFQGTGLGLSICKGLVDLMGGTIGFTSEPGKGSTFFFNLPRTARPSRDELPTSPPPSRLPKGRPTVLLVEDEEYDARVIAGGLRMAGYVVARARTAEEALARIDTVKPSLLVIDLSLPGISGFEFVEQIRARAAWQRTPIAVLSARDLSAEDRARLAASVNLIVRKGDMTREELVARLVEISAPSKLRVLVVDDSEPNRKVLRAILERVGCEVIEVADAESGLRVAREGSLGVILMDIQMPGMDGLTATGHLKADPATSAIPVVAVTAHAMAGDAERAKAAGCVAYVSKPIARARLFDAIDLALGGAAWRVDGTLSAAHKD